MPHHASPIAALLAGHHHAHRPYLLGHPDAVDAYLDRWMEAPHGATVYKAEELLTRAGRKDLSLATRQRLVEAAIGYAIESEVPRVSMLVGDLLRRHMIQPSRIVVRHFQEHLRLYGAEDLALIREGLADGSLFDSYGSTQRWISSLAAAHLATTDPETYPLLPRPLVRELGEAWLAIQARWRSRWMVSSGGEGAHGLRVLTGDTPWDMVHDTALPAAPERNAPWLSPASLREPAALIARLVDHPHDQHDWFLYDHIVALTREVQYIEELFIDLPHALLTGDIPEESTWVIKSGGAPMGPDTQIALQEGLAGARSAAAAHRLAELAATHWARFPDSSSAGLIRGILQAKARYKSVQLRDSLASVVPCTPESAALWWELALATLVQDQNGNFEMGIRSFLQAQTAQLAAYGYDAAHCRVPPIGVWEHYGPQLSAGPRMLILRDAPHLARTTPAVRARPARRRR